ncbi:MAG TPA: cache domain-containing protein [Geobacteraceae bacterium]
MFPQKMITLSCLAASLLLLPFSGNAETLYEHGETRDLVQLVGDAAKLVHAKGDAAFGELSRPGSRWRQDEKYIFVLNLKGDMLVHPDPALEGRNQLDLRDVNGRPIIQGLIGAATAAPGKPEGWYHYQWPVPRGLLPRWKSSYVRLVQAPSGTSYVVASGVYNDRMERAFVVDAVTDAVGEIEKHGSGAFQGFHDQKGPFMFKDAYIFVIDMNGVDLVNPAFPNLEGRNILDVKDTQGKKLIREMLEVVQTKGAGWVDYLWPKPGESVSTQKSAYVAKARLGDQWVLVGCGVYLADAPKAVATTPSMTAPELVALVREAAAVFEQRGDKAYPEFRTKGSKWFRDGTYFFVWTMEGIRTFLAPDPKGEGLDVSNLKDVLGRPIGKMFLEAAATPSGEGWGHYMYPEPGGIFPTWKSTFVKRVTFPSGKQYLIGCGIYNMDMNRGFVEDVVNRAAALIAARGKDAFGELRDRTGPFLFMETYVFVEDLNGNELVNPAQPSLEGKNLIDVKDLKGKLLVREYIEAAVKSGSAWVDYYWYKPGNNTPAPKHAYVRKVRHGAETYVVGSGLYVPTREEEKKNE